MLDVEQYLLVKLAEECSEVAQMAMKSAQYGLKEVKEGQDLTNAERLNSELNDLHIILTLMKKNKIFAFKQDKKDTWIAKLEKVAKYFKLSQSKGRTA